MSDELEQQQEDAAKSQGIFGSARTVEGAADRPESVQISLADRVTAIEKALKDHGIHYDGIAGPQEEAGESEESDEAEE